MASDLVVVEAILNDADSVMELINKAYEVEIGSDGVAFKRDGINRLLHVSELYEDITNRRVLIAVNKNNRDVILGTIIWSIESNKLTFGPFAVSNSRRSEGIGKLLIDKVYSIALAHEISIIEIKVTDICMITICQMKICNEIIYELLLQFTLH